MSETLHIWLGHFKSAQQYSAFFKETYSDDDDKPINAFAKSQNETWYDHDWLEAHLNEKEEVQSEFIARHIPGPYLAIVNALMAERGIGEVNAVILFADDWGKNTQSIVVDPTIWYLGEFNEQTIKSLRAALDETSVIVDTSWWTQFPETDAELAALEKQSRKRKGQLPANAKLAMMYISGKYVDQDDKLAKKYLSKVEPYPEILHACFKANGDAGDAEAWLRLAQLHSREFDGAVSREEREAFQEKAIALGSISAKWGMANSLMYGRNGRNDTLRAESLLLEVHEQDERVDYELFCLYHMKGKPIYNPEKAFHWLSKSAQRTGSASNFNYLAHAYVKGDGVDINPTLMCKYLYLQKCQNTNSDLKSFIDRMDAIDIEVIKAGRKLAKDWIQNNAVNAIRFKGDLCDPFEQYLLNRKT